MVTPPLDSRYIKVHLDHIIKLKLYCIRFNSMYRIFYLTKTNVHQHRHESIALEGTHLPWTRFTLSHTLLYLSFYILLLHHHLLNNKSNVIN